MTNDLGHLPKREELDDKNRERLETWYAKAYQDDNLFRTLANDDLTLNSDSYTKLTLPPTPYV